jgi:hypothetical protein
MVLLASMMPDDVFVRMRPGAPACFDKGACRNGRQARRNRGWFTSFQTQPFMKHGKQAVKLREKSVNAGDSDVP